MIGNSGASMSTAAERRHEVLDGADAHTLAHQARGEPRVADEVRARGNIDRRFEVDAAEDDAGIGRRRAQRDARLLAGVQADAAGADQGLEGALPEHGGADSIRGG
jgi:hypothetical protein